MNNLDMSLAPEFGYCLAFFMDNSVILDQYKIKKGCFIMDNHNDINFDLVTRCHLFNDKAEYRALHFSSSNKDIVVVLTEDEEKSMNPLYLKEQIIYLNNSYKINNKTWIRVINRFNFNENNCIYLDNYRLAGLI